MQQTQESRFRLAKSHINILETLYKESPRPCLRVRKELALRMGIEQRKVQIWFQNRRAKDVREAQSTTANLAHLNVKSKDLYESSDVSSISSERSSPETSRMNIQNDNPSSKKVLSHYWASTMNSCKILQF